MDDREKSYEQFLSGGGEMGALIRSTDWKNSVLGEPSGWPQSLKTCVRIILTSRQPMFVWWGKELINLYNDAYISIIGGKHPVALGQPAKLVWQEIWNEVGPRAATVMDKNEGTYDEALLLIMERNGYPEETYYTFSYSPVPGDQGGTDGIICANTDDTDRIISERQLRTLKDLGNSIIDCRTDDDVYRTAINVLNENQYDFPFCILYEVDTVSNKLVQAGKYPTAHENKIATGDIELSDLAQSHEYLAKALASGKMTVVNASNEFGSLPKGPWSKPPERMLVLPISHSNLKTPYAVLVAGINPFRLFDERYKSFFQIVVDQVSTALANVHAYEEERKRALALQEIDKAKTVFFSNISHEFRTPLTLMLGPLEELLTMRPAELPVVARENVETTHRNAMRLLRLVNALLDFSRIEAGRLKASFRKINLSAYTADLASTFRSVIEKAGLKYNVNTSANITAYVDTDMWEKIVLNLLSNAFKYTLNGSVSVTLTTDEDHIVLSVTDTGAGIPEEELPKMFERFHRVPNAAGRTFEGTGIGLSLVHELVSQHEGTISVTSELEKGSSFIVTIPCGNAHLPPEQVSDAEKELSTNLADTFIQEALTLADEVTAGNISPESGKIAGNNQADSVLIVDDNADMRNYIRSILGKTYQVFTAADGAEALEKVYSLSPSLVVSDIMMPVMDGIELVKSIKSHPAISSIPVILLSARAGEESKIEGIETGADDYLVKPFSSKELLSRVSAQIKAVRTRRHVELQLSNLFKHAPVAICLFKGPDHVIEVVNERMLEIWDSTREQVINKPARTALPTLIEQGFETIMNQVYSTGERFIANEIPVEITRRGTPESIYVKLVYEPLYDEESSITGIMTVPDDITEQVNARRAVEESDARQKLAIDAAELGSFEWDMKSANFIYSPRLAEIFGLPGTVKLAHNDFTKALHPDDTEIRVSAHRQAVITGKLFYELRFFWPDGSVRWVRTHGKVVYDKDGSPIKMYGTAMDITAQKLEEDVLEDLVKKRTADLQTKNAELKQSEERYHKMTDAVQDYAILLLNKDGIVLNWNKGAEKIKGYKDHEIVGKSFRLFYLPEDRETKLPERLIKEATTNGRATHEGYRMRKDGTLLWANVVVTSLFDDQNNLIGFSKVTRDLTDKKIAEDKMNVYMSELEIQNRELEQFAYIASHDLQEPLRKIMTFSEMLQRNFDDRNAAFNYIKKINYSARRMSELITAVLEYSRVSRGDIPFEEVDLNTILQNVMVDFELLISEKNAEINATELPQISAFPLQIHQLFSNLIGNSLKFSDTRPVITISAQVVDAANIDAPQELKTAKKYTQLIFSDNGIGFDQRYANQIFTIFQRLHGNAKFSGTGIGLALCKKIVENHGGFISASSAPGEGATFYVSIPIQEYLAVPVE